VKDENLIPSQSLLSVPAFLDWHPALRKMRRTIEPRLDAYDGDAFALLARLALLNGREPFWRDEVSR